MEKKNTLHQIIFQWHYLHLVSSELDSAEKHLRGKFLTHEHIFISSTLISH